MKLRKRSYGVWNVNNWAHGTITGNDGVTSSLWMGYRHGKTEGENLKCNFFFGIHHGHQMDGRGYFMSDNIIFTANKSSLTGIHYTKC